MFCHKYGYIRRKHFLFFILNRKVTRVCEKNSTYCRLHYLLLMQIMPKYFSQSDAEKYFTTQITKCSKHF